MRTPHPDGFMCLVCHTRTRSEGQLCPTCVEQGHRVENDTLLVNFDIFVQTKPGTSWTFVRPITDEEQS